MHIRDPFVVLANESIKAIISLWCVQNLDWLCETEIFVLNSDLGSSDTLVFLYTNGLIFATLPLVTFALDQPRIASTFGSFLLTQVTP